MTAAMMIASRLNVKQERTEKDEGGLFDTGEFPKYFEACSRSWWQPYCSRNGPIIRRQAFPSPLTESLTFPAPSQEARTVSPTSLESGNTAARLARRVRWVRLLPLKLRPPALNSFRLRCG